MELPWETSRGDAAAGDVGIFRGDGSRRRRSVETSRGGAAAGDVDVPWRRVAAAPRLRRVPVGPGYGVQGDVTIIKRHRKRIAQVDKPRFLKRARPCAELWHKDGRQTVFDCRDAARRDAFVRAAQKRVEDAASSKFAPSRAGIAGLARRQRRKRDDAAELAAETRTDLRKLAARRPRPRPGPRVFERRRDAAGPTGVAAPPRRRRAS